ncbi:MAG: ABC-2 family transporter protein [Verrucomicrobiota bacterium]|nr:ABC-2 family transporter protein [Limisphaera sp.]MDW8381645.1 ABC-2 family transporter protein [Verrucomicrobiota bacterium]
MNPPPLMTCAMRLKPPQTLRRPRCGAEVRKYLQVLGLGFQSHLAYRFNFLARVLFSLIPLTALLMLWETIYAGQTAEMLVGGYTRSEMLAYYLVAAWVHALTAVTEDDWQIAADIRDGNINHLLAKPVNYLAYRLCLFASGRVVYAGVAALPLAGFVWISGLTVYVPTDLAVWMWFALSLALTALLQFFISFALAMLAFWVLEVSTFIFIVYAFEYIASGHLFPLDLLPESLRWLLPFTPFPYELYFPVSIYLGKTTGSALVRGLVLQCAWVGISWWMAWWAWRRGLRRYGAVGG